MSIYVGTEMAVGFPWDDFLKAKELQSVFTNE